MPDRRQSPSFLTAALRVMDLSIGRCCGRAERSSWRWWCRARPDRGGDPTPDRARTAARSRITGPGAFASSSGCYLRFTVPILASSTNLPDRDEVDDKTITYLFTRRSHGGRPGRQIPRLHGLTAFVVLPRMLVYLFIVPIRGDLAGSFIPALKTWVCCAGSRCTGRCRVHRGSVQRPCSSPRVRVRMEQRPCIPGYLKRSRLPTTPALVPTRCLRTAP